jgi:7,8-dihydroneopterin aldolase/epimerase/oxygenase
VTPDRIVVRGLRAHGRHGVYEHERRDGQDFLVDVVLAVDTEDAGHSDELDQTVDYSRLITRLVAVVEGEPVNLLESLARRLADVCLADRRVEQVEVTVHKPEAPVDAPFDDIAVTIVRTRA